MKQQQLKVRKTNRKGGHYLRVWLEGEERLHHAGFFHSVRYDREISDGAIYLRVNPEGRYKVAGKQNKKTGQWRPIIDISAKDLPGFQAGDDLTATFYAGVMRIHIHKEDLQQAA